MEIIASEAPTGQVSGEAIALGDFVALSRPSPSPTGASLSVSFTIIEAGQGRAHPAKTFGVSESGQPIVTHHGGQPAAGTAHRKRLSGAAGEILSDFGKTLESLTSREALVCAPPPAGRAAWPFVTITEAAGRTDVIARSRDNFPGPAGAALFGLDFDIKAWPAELQERVRAEPGQVSGILVAVAPAFAQAAALRRASSSAGVRNRLTGDETDANAGQHRFFVVTDGRDVGRATKALHERLILAGWGWGFVHQTGHVEVRSLIDLAASSAPERLWFEGQVKLADDRLEHVDGGRKASLLNDRGGALDTSKIADLSRVEQDQLAEMSAAIVKANAAEAGSKLAAWKAIKRDAMIARGVDPEKAARTAGLAVEQHTLTGDWEILFDDGTSATVAEILADPSAYHRKTGPDPFEPEYGGGRNKAVLFTDGNPARIESQAHGGIRYVLQDWRRFFEEPTATPDKVAAADGKTDGRAGASSIFEEPAARPPLAGWIDPTAWEGKPVRVREWVVPGMIPFGEVTLLYGDGGTGKTLVMQQLAAACATGLDWLGQPVRPSRPLLYLCEDDTDELHRRQRDINRALGVGYADLGAMRLVGRVGENNMLAVFDQASKQMKLTPAFDELVAAAKSFGANLVIVDTIADTFGGSEIDRSQVNGFVKGCLKRIANEIGGTVIALGHPSQSGKQTGDGSSGSTAWNNAVRSRLYLTPVGNDPTSTVRELTTKKSNYAAKGATLKIRWRAGAFEVIAGTMPADRSRDRIGVLPIADAAEKAVVSVLLDRPDERLVMTRNSPYFAPKVLMRIGGEGLSPFSGYDIEAAMGRLIASGKVRADGVGRDASRRKVPGFVVELDKLSAGSAVKPSIFE